MFALENTAMSLIIANYNDPIPTCVCVCVRDSCRYNFGPSTHLSRKPVLISDQAEPGVCRKHHACIHTFKQTHTPLEALEEHRQKLHEHVNDA